MLVRNIHTQRSNLLNLNFKTVQTIYNGKAKKRSWSS
ncbi:MAG: hypothetical protein RL335_995 [Bacteroidota bacterium]|jgi:hypothetical protein